jgi:DNA polymerase III alpha subunit
MGMPDDLAAYCELHAHSNFSFLDGASHVEDLVAQAALLDLPALAITDHAGLYAAVRLVKAAEQTQTDAARSAGLSPVRPIIGLELSIPRDENELRLVRRGRKLNDPLRGERASRGWPGELHAGPMPGDHLVLLARDGDGYTALSRLASRGHLAGEKQFPIFERSLVETALDEARGHLIGLSGCRNGEVPRHLLAGDSREALSAAQRWASHFPEGSFGVELSHHLQPDDDWLVAQLAELAQRAGVPTVVTNEVHYAEPGGHRLQDVLVCIRHGATLTEARELLLPNAEYRLKSAAELAAIGAALPQAGARRAWRQGMAEAARIGQACRLDLNFERYRFPGFTVPEGETPFSYLYQLAHDGLLRRYRPITKRALQQLTHELDIIERTHLAEFFLIVWDLMEFARQRGIIGQGRGSAGDSIVAYCLGITKVDPIEHKLLFERFINEARTLPDIDIDFDVNRREEVIQYLYTTYGADHAAMVCTIVTYRARSAVREVAKALGFPLESVDKLAKALDTRDASDVARDLALDGSFAWLFDELGIDMDAAAVPPGRDGRGKPVSEGGWYPPKRPRVFDQSVTAVRFEATQTKRYAAGVVPEHLPQPRDTGSPGPASERRAVVRVDPESGMPIEERYRPSVVRRSVVSLAGDPQPGQTSTRSGLGESKAAGAATGDGNRSGNHANLGVHDHRQPSAAAPSAIGLPKPGVIRVWQESGGSDAHATDAADATDATDATDAGATAATTATTAATHAAPRNRWQWLLQLCGEIDAFPRHLGIHVGGMLVTRTPLIDLVPIEKATMPNRVVTQYDKEDIEQLGLVKIDLLSLRTLGVVSDALDRIERDTGTRPDLDSLPHDDPDVFKTIRSADTVGMFQIESRAQMQALPKARPERFEDLVVQVAIIRPGPIQGNAVHPYLRRRAGAEEVTYLHPSLEPILEDTLGVILYQEQVMQIAIDVCGYTPLEADIFRKAMGSHRSHREMEKEHTRFVAGAQRTGLTADDAEELFKRCGAFAEFGFARAHAAAFAKITYDTAWLKLHYPAHYYAGILNNQPMGFYSPAVIVNDAKRHGIAVLPVDVNESAWEHDTRPMPDGRFALRLGLSQVKGIGEAERERLTDERATGPYRSVREFVARTGLGEQVVERLISIGAFDWTDAPRRELLWQLRSTLADANPARPALGLTDDAQRTLGASLPAMTDAERVAADYRDTGVSPNLHAVELYRERLAAGGVIRVADAGRRRDRSMVRLAGLAVSIQHPMTAKHFVFIALEDESGMINVTLRPDVYQRYRGLLHRHPLLVIDGVLQVEGEVLNVVARRVRGVDEVVADTTRLDLARQQRMFR